MRGLFHHHGEDADTPRLIATVTNISEREWSALSKSIHARHGNNGKVRRRMPCFVFNDHISESNDIMDFFLTISNGTAFIDTRTCLSPGQTIRVFFPASDNQGSVEIMGEVIWIGSKALAHH